MVFGILITNCITTVLLQIPSLNYGYCSKTMFFLWLPWFNYSNHCCCCFFVVKPWLIYVRIRRMGYSRHFEKSRKEEGRGSKRENVARKGVLMVRFS